MWKTASILVTVVLVLVTLGIIMLASTSSVHGRTIYKDSLYFIKRQILSLMIGFVAAAILGNVDYRYYRGFMAVFLGALSFILLVMVLIPGIGINVNGSFRWLRFGPMTFQPSELAKFTTVLFLSWWMARIQRHAHELRVGLVTPLLCLGAVLGLIFIEPDFGTTMLIAVVGMTMMFVAGTRVSYLAVASAVGLAGFSLAIMQDAERMRRITAFLNPEKYAKDEAFQLLNAIYAFVVGGGGGVGLGQSLQKRFYLPEAHTDFIFAILGEEMGLAASILVVVLFLGFFICGVRISFRAPDQFGRLLGLGLTLMIVVQAAINIGVVTGSLPTKGLPLPFISYGGTSLVVSLAMVGVLVNIARQAGDGSEPDESRYFKDAAHSL